MRILAAVFCLQLLYLSSSCYGEDKTAAVVEVVGFGECKECQKTNVEPSKAFQGLRVTIDCKTADGKIERRVVGELDKQGKFAVFLDHDLAQDGKLKEECYAQLHSASAQPCPVESSKVVFVSKEPGKHSFGLEGKLTFSPATCASAFLWPYYKHPPLPTLPPLPKLPPVPKDHPWFKHFPYPPIYKKPFPPSFLPPTPVYVKPKPPPAPVYVKPNPPPTPVYEPPHVHKPHVHKPPVKKPCPQPPVYKKPPVYKPPVKKPCPPPTPVYKKPPVYNPPVYSPPKKELPPPVPKYKKPLPPIPVYKPLPPIPKFPLPPPVPIYKKPLPPIVPYKPLPPIPIFKKPPCPPLPKSPSLPKVPPYPHA